MIFLLLNDQRRFLKQALMSERCAPKAIVSRGLGHNCLAGLRSMFCSTAEGQKTGKKHFEAEGRRNILSATFTAMVQWGGDGHGAQ